MSLVPQSLRRRRALLAASGAALVAAIATVLVLNSTPAAATWQTFSGTPTCDCVVQDSKTNTYRAVFGYVSSASKTGKIDAGDNNKVVLSGTSKSTDAKVTTRFEPGTHKASFATGWISKDTQATWKVGGKNVTAHWNKPTCGRDVSLPAGGNGSGPLLALLIAALVGGGIFFWRKRRTVTQP
ncbi:hypothetical protein ACTI_83450 [Actinoplanes sp. OR16]|uniref:hypothetical protein n=1 Tax=Actinoplanes sp. OR16 TaxID=946334 RepID=UPI000F6B5A3F|nr:hypothetical protein [Actinoplanes sp. OR16]BBH71660.1 hypothetical protein ACTI_83450 [Actinoplanes sp. OR16]